MSETVPCRKCNRPLRSEASRAAGIGPRCAAVEAAAEGLNDRQRDKMAQALADKAVTRGSRKGTARVSSDDGESVYLAHVNGNCTCPWGLRRVSALARPCYHVPLARLAWHPVLRPAPCAVRRAIPLPPAPGDVWAALAAVGAVTAGDMVPAF